jgi:hypothetical protein
MAVPWGWRFLDGWRGLPDNSAFAYLSDFFQRIFRPIEQG